MNLIKTVVRGTALAVALGVLSPLVAIEAGLVASATAYADVIRVIVVKGNTRIDPETVKNYVLITPGKEFGPNQINESVKALYGTGLFADVKIDTNGTTLVVIVVENPVVNSVTFQGNDKIKTDQLTNIIETKSR